MLVFGTASLAAIACGEDENEVSGFEDRDGYENRVKAAIEQIELEIQQLEERAEAATGERAEELRAEADQLRAARGDLRNYYELLRQAQTQAEWQEARALIERFKETYPKAARFL